MDFQAFGSIANDSLMLFTQYCINVRGLPLPAVTFKLHYLPRCLRSTVTCNKMPATVT